MERRWSEDEFRKVASETRITERTLNACRDVLVNGMTGVATAGKHKMFPAQISRALTTLREKQDEMGKSVVIGAVDLEQYIASEVGRALVGPDFECDLAQGGRVYEGSILAQSKGFLVQKVGRGGVLHPISAFEQMPPMNQLLTITYDKNNGKATIALGQSKSQEIER